MLMYWNGLFKIFMGKRMYTGLNAGKISIFP